MEDLTVASAVANNVVDSKKPRKKPNRPQVSHMVTGAIKYLNKRGGSSLQGIKKHISESFKVDAEKLSLFIKKFIKSAVSNGKLIQTKGKGCSGSFKLAVTGKSTKEKGVPKKKSAPKKLSYTKREPESNAAKEETDDHQHNEADKMRNDSIGQNTQISFYEGENSRLVKEMESLNQKLNEALGIVQTLHESEMGRLRKNQDDLMVLLVEQVCERTELRARLGKNQDDLMKIVNDQIDMLTKYRALLMRWNAVNDDKQ